MSQVQETRTPKARKKPRPILSLRPGKFEVMSILSCLVVLGVVGLRTWLRMERNERRRDRIAAQWEEKEEVGNSTEIPEKTRKPKRVRTPEQEEAFHQVTNALGTLERLERKAAQVGTVAGIQEALNSAEVRAARQDYESKLAKLHPDDVTTIKEIQSTNFSVVQFQIDRAEMMDGVNKRLNDQKRQWEAENTSHPLSESRAWKPTTPPPASSDAEVEAILQESRDTMAQTRENAQRYLEEMETRAEERSASRRSSVPSTARVSPRPEPRFPARREPRFSTTPDDDQRIPIAREPEPDASAAVETSEDLSDPRIAARFGFLKRDIPLPAGGAAALYEVRWNLEKSKGSGKFMMGIYNVPDDRNFSGKIFLAGNPEKFNRDFRGKVTYKPDVEYPVSIDLDLDTGVADKECRSAMLQRFFQCGATINGEKTTNLRVKFADADITGFSKGKTVSFTFVKLTKEDVQEIMERNAK